MYSKLTIEQLRKYYQNKDSIALENPPDLGDIDDTKKKLILENLKIKRNEKEYLALQEKLNTQEIKEIEYNQEKELITGLLKVTHMTRILIKIASLNKRK